MAPRMTSDDPSDGHLMTYDDLGWPRNSLGWPRMTTECALCALGDLITTSSQPHQGTEFQKYTHGSFATRASHPCRLFVRHDKPPGLLCYTNLSSRTRKEKSFPLDEISEVRDRAPECL